MKITADINTAFAEVKKLNLSSINYIEVIQIICDFGIAVEQEATKSAIKIMKR